MDKTNLDKIIRTRRSVRKYKNRKLPRAEIEKIIEAGTYAPSACNMQMWHFVAVDDERIKSRLKSHAGCPQIMKDAPATVFVFYDRNVNKEHYANIQSAAAAIQNMLLEAHSIGIGSVWMCTYGDKEKVRKLLGVPQNFILVAAVCFGYPDESPSCPKRREGVVSFNSFGREKTANEKIEKYPTTFDPAKWTMEQVRDYREFSIRAKSPSSEEHHPEMKGEFKAIVEEIPKIEGSVLDVFPHFANYSYALLAAGKLKDVTIYEMSDAVVSFLKKKFKQLNGVKFKTGINLRFQSHFDAVLCLESLEKVPNPEKIISAAAECLKKDGTLYVLFINKSSVTAGVHRLRMMRGLPVRVPFNPLPYRRVKSMIEKNGFVIEDTVGIGIIPKTKTGNYKTRGPMKRFCKFMLVKARKK